MTGMNKVTERIQDFAGVVATVGDRGKSSRVSMREDDGNQLGAKMLKWVAQSGARVQANGESDGTKMKKGRERRQTVARSARLQ